MVADGHSLALILPITEVFVLAPEDVSCVALLGQGDLSLVPGGLLDAETKCADALPVVVSTACDGHRVEHLLVYTLRLLRFAGCYSVKVDVSLDLDDLSPDQ